MSRKATAGRPGVPGAFSGPSKGARWLHKSSGICHIVGTAVLVDIASLPYSWEVYPIKIALSGFRTDSKPYAKQLRRAITVRLDERTIEYFDTLAQETGIPYRGNFSNSSTGGRRHRAGAALA